MRRWFVQKYASASWTQTAGTIDFVSLFAAGSFSKFFSHDKESEVARLNYSYDVEGKRYFGHYDQTFPIRAAAEYFIRGLEKRPVIICFNPNKHRQSVLPTEEVEHLLESRPDSAEADASFYAATKPPDWLRPFLWPLAVLATIGFTLGACIHIADWMGKKLFPTFVDIALYVGLGIILPVVGYIAKRRGAHTAHDLFKDTPKWLVIMDFVFGIYALFNFLILSGTTHSHTATSFRSPLLSGHWMALYSSAFTVLYGAILREERFSQFGAMWNFPNTQK